MGLLTGLSERHLLYLTLFISTLFSFKKSSVICITILMSCNDLFSFSTDGNKDRWHWPTSSTTDTIAAETLSRWKTYLRNISFLRWKKTHFFDLPAEGCQKPSKWTSKTPSKVSHITYALTSGQKKLLKNMIIMVRKLVNWLLNRF